VPPEVTVGVAVLELGAVETLPVFPVEPVLDDVEVPAVSLVVAELDAFELPALAPAPDAPGWSWAATMPIATVAPAAARTAARVTLRRRPCTFSRLSGALD
jgi:hypothetical protein